MRDRIIFELKKIIRDIRNRDVEFDENTRLEEDLALDSLDKIEIWLSLEEAFKIDIAEDEAKTVKTVDDLIHLVKKYEENKSADTNK